MNDDLRDRLDAVEQAVDAPADGWIVGYLRDPDGPVLDEDGDPLPDGVEPDAILSAGLSQFTLPEDADR
jgi:hypothetical protein